MQARLILVRHARAQPSFGNDLLRPLSREGTVQAHALGVRLRPVASGSVILCSPALRCVQTAGELRSAMDIETPPQVRDELGEHADAARLEALVAALGAATLLVGHQPSLSQLAARLLGATGAPVSFTPATAAVFERHAPGHAWTLAAVVGVP